MDQSQQQSTLEIQTVCRMNGSNRVEQDMLCLSPPVGHGICLIAVDPCGNTNKLSRDVMH